MTKERLKSPRARLFVALDLPDEVREGLVAWQHEALTDQALRPIPPEALHVTLCFLAYQPERDIERIAAVMRWVDPRRVQVRFKEEPAAVPPNRPRLFAADAESEAAIELQAELSDRLEAERFYRPEKRPFWPHVTVARIKPSKRSASDRRGRRRGRPMHVETPPKALPAELCEPFSAVRVTLYRSNLRPTGAEYVSLACLGLPPPG
ncbi:MAG: 2'-5' RNA ligase [Actinobacteria bacterium 13_1_20CM_3_68_9]|jgi:2'-5' RNA ligase|nr:MAG: 2'-5' RNA ligase [Actinobacteria bacterium 13_1_20CM_3_68_9]